MIVESGWTTLGSKRLRPAIDATCRACLVAAQDRAIGAEAAKSYL